jgi:Tol biopolymer transport system component
LAGSGAGLRRVSPTGGGISLLTKIDPAAMETGHGYPQFLPDGDRFLYFVASDDPSVQGMYSSTLTDPTHRKLLLRTAAKAVYVPARGLSPPYLLWLQDQTLLAQRFNPTSLTLEGAPLSVAEDVGLNPNPNQRIRAAYWASNSGLLVYFAAPALLKRPLEWIARNGMKLGPAAPEDTVASVAISPPGDRVALTRTEVVAGIANTDVWILETTRPAMPRLTFDPASDRLPAWSPDGKFIAFSSARAGSPQIFLKSVSGGGAEERLTDGPTPKLALEWSRDGKYILYRETNPETQRDLMAIPVDGERKPFPVVNTPFNESTGALSPDGRWVAYSSNESGVYRLYVQAFPGVAGAPSGHWQISTGSAYEVKWPGDGSQIYYQTLEGRMMAAIVQTGPQGVRIEDTRELFTADVRSGGLHEFDVTSDGKRFLLILNPATQNDAQRLTVVSDWQLLVRK